MMMTIIRAIGQKSKMSIMKRLFYLILKKWTNQMINTLRSTCSKVIVETMLKNLTMKIWEKGWRIS